MVRPIIMKVESARRTQAAPPKQVTVKVAQLPNKTATNRSVVVLSASGSQRGVFDWMEKAKADRARYRRGGKKTSVVAKKVSEVKAAGLAPKEVKIIMKPFRG